MNEAIRSIRAMLTDVDGVLTDGGITLDNQGVETKTFFVRDGLGIRIWRRAGYRIGWITARSSQIVRLRGSELGVDPILQGVQSKIRAVRDVIASWNLEPHEVCYIGDDLTDLAAMEYVGFGIAVADAASELQTTSDWTTTLPGGRGCVREAIETILKQQGRWDDLVRAYRET